MSKPTTPATPTMYTLAEAAAKIGCHKSTASRQAAKHSIGTRVGRQVILTTDEIATLAGLIAVATPGNPNFVVGNYFGQPPTAARRKLRRR